MAPRKYRMDKRRQAVEDTRQRITDATVILHGKQGILATSWEDIAKKADVALATVYRHFPSLDELVGACGQEVAKMIKPPTPESIGTNIKGSSSTADRATHLVRELLDFYDRGRTFLDIAYQESRQVTVLEEWLNGWESNRKAIVAEVFQLENADDLTTRMIMALTEFRVWQSLADQGISKDDAVERLAGLLVHLLAARHDSTLGV